MLCMFLFETKAQADTRALHRYDRAVCIYLKSAAKDGRPLSSPGVFYVLFEKNWKKNKGRSECKELKNVVLRLFGVFLTITCC